MKKLETIIKKGIFTYHQEQRNDVFAIYRQMHENVLVGHEVFKINKYEERIINDTIIPAHKSLPGDNQFGVTAFSTGKEYNRALDKYNELCLNYQYRKGKMVNGTFVKD